MTDEELKELAEIVHGPCPFCHWVGGKIIADFDGKISGGEPALLHSLPVCSSYRNMDGDAFVQAVIDRRHMQ